MYYTARGCVCTDRRESTNCTLLYSFYDNFRHFPLNYVLIFKNVWTITEYTNDNLVRSLSYCDLRRMGKFSVSCGRLVVRIPLKMHVYTRTWKLLLKIKALSKFSMQCGKLVVRIPLQIHVFPILNFEFPSHSSQIGEALTNETKHDIHPE